jgi:hypothetical protein
MEGVQVLSSELLWMPEPGGASRVRLIDLMTGKTSFVLTEDPSAAPILSGNNVYCLGRSGILTCWDLDLGRLRWRTAKAYGRLHAVSGGSLYATDENNLLAVIDALSGEAKRRFAELGAIETITCDNESLSAVVHRADGSQALALISLDSGHEQWKQVLPQGVEVQHVISAPDGFGVTLLERADNLPITSVLMLGKDGGIHLAEGLSKDEHVTPVAGALLVHGPSGVRVLPYGLPVVPASIPCSSVKAAGDLTAAATAALPKLSWQRVGSAAYAVAWHGDGLLLFARLGADATPLTLRLGDGDTAIDHTSLIALFPPIGPAQLTGNGAWVLDGVKQLSQTGEPPLSVLRLLPAAKTAPTTSLKLRAENGPHSDAGTAPWWLRRAWRPVSGGP